MASTTAFLNRPNAQARLGFHPPINFTAINFDLNMLRTNNPTILIPPTKHLTYLRDGGDAGENNETVFIPILAIDGEYDVGCNAPGTLLTYDHLAWNGQAGFWAQRSGLWKKSAAAPDKASLTVATVHEAGHMAPED
ncbi:hypothetical protein BDV19DRAFT_395582 [Aspergillus venezuelensis]